MSQLETLKQASANARRSEPGSSWAGGRRRAWFPLALVLWAHACQAGSVTDSDAGGVPPGAPPPDGGAIQRVVLTVQVSIDAADVSIAAAVGVAVAGLSVRVARVNSPEQPRENLTDTNGRSTFEGLLQGVYQVSVDRPLTSEEIARLGPEHADATIFAGGTTVVVAPPAGSAPISLVASRRGSLIISELSTYGETVVGGANGRYLEVYNAADTTVYIDGVVLFMSNSHSAGEGTFAPCELWEDFRLDPTGVWARKLYKVPGNARDYPIQPGRARVLATDAIDHRPLGGSMQDLSTADFEFIGNDADPNNPFAADMLRLKGGEGPNGEGFSHNLLYGLASASIRDTLQLERRQPPGSAIFSLFRIPRDQILDVVGFAISRGYEARFSQGVSSTCEPFASPNIERDPARLLDSFVPMAISRKSLGRTNTGIELLQRTRTGARDFELAPFLTRSLRRVP